ncbi:hypothetical protein CAEBREN_02336 [Caenorhabditis brenneri]|uniref:Uncharacterized protein n=1 Tax=Caenorhabditis brenneri TaxID=135651 RepID=G0NQ61_CAEBE|nr:hypothetical protein CAEBREN_02336 [Caenorhabditis brenneri]
MSNTTSSGASNRFNMGKVKSEREWERVRETKTKEEWAPTEHTMEAQDFDNIIKKVVEQKRDIQTGANVFYKIPGSFAIFGEIEYLVERFNILSVDEKKIKIHWKPTPKNSAGNSTATAIQNPARTRSAYWDEELVAPSTVKLQEKIDELQEKVDDLMEKYNSVQEAVCKMQEKKDNRDQQ